MDRSKVARELRRFWLYRINEVTGRPEGTVADWLTKGAYTWKAAPSATSFQISIPIGEEKFRSAFSSECARFASAAFETFLFAEPPAAQGKSLGWSVIRSYYGAFFCAHSLLRAFGRSICYIDAAQAKKISDILALQLGPTTNQIRSGIYALESNSRATELVGTNLLVGASHEQLWAEFSDWLNYASTILIGTGDVDSIAAADCLKEIKQGLSSAGSSNGAWLSVIRNQVNYGQGYGVWYPYKISDRARDSLHASLNRWQGHDVPSTLSTLGRGGELERFLQICTSLGCMLLGVMDEISARCPQGRSFVDLRALPLYRQMSTA